MRQEIRVYFEAYEQAVHFVLPPIQKYFPSVNIRLIQISSISSHDSSAARIFRFKFPDILITFVSDDVEVPLLIIEFSEAVVTEDHELQRFDGLLAGVAGNCPYLKISPFKKSSSAHGGNTEFDTFEPYVVIYKKFKALAFHIEWPQDEGQTLRNNPYFSCPVELPAFNDLIRRLMETVRSAKIAPEFKLADSLIPHLRKDSFFSNWIDKLEKARLEETHQNMASSRVCWLEKEKIINFKFNRMGHAMDPERGMIWYMKYRHDGKPIRARIQFPTRDSIFQNLKLGDDLSYLFAFISGMGLSRTGHFLAFLKIKGYLKDDKLKNNEIDLTEFIETHIDDLSKPLLAIFATAQEFVIEDSKARPRVRFCWNYVFDQFVHHRSYNVPLSIKEVETAGEDIVTYITVHQCLRPNGFQIRSVSYPGAQSAAAILPKLGTGRKQSRSYVDVISTIDKQLALTESKEKLRGGLKKDVERLIAYKNDHEFIKALNRLLKAKYEKGDILLSVSFCSDRPISKDGALLDDLDFFISIHPKSKKWKVWQGGAIDLFKIKEGSYLIKDIFTTV